MPPAPHPSSSSPHVAPATVGRLATAALATGAAAVAVLALAAAPAGAAVSHAPRAHIDSMQVRGGVAHVRGWALDPDTTRATHVRLRLDRRAPRTVTASQWSADLAQHRRGAAAHHGFRAAVTVPEGTHRLCATAANAGPGRSQRLHCWTVRAHYRRPGRPTHLRTSRTYDSITVHWHAPHKHGGGVLHDYHVRAVPSSGRTVYRHAPGDAHYVTVHGLRSAHRYTIFVKASNVAHRSRHAVTHATTAMAPVPPQRTPAPLTRSHYLRALTGSTAHDAAAMRRMGAADGAMNVRGHRYLVLHDIGAQTSGGVILSATTTHISYGALVSALEAYLAGYASAQHSAAPATIALGTNNDGAVSYGQGQIWAQRVVNPVRGWAFRHTHLAVAGADDMEPGFSASPHATASWLSGYLSATSARFVFNGSADGCPTTVGYTGCNNGWTSTQLHALAGGAGAAGRIVALPQIYNTVMPWQWQVISAIGARRLYFGGPLTEKRACAQAGSCYSVSGPYAWKLLFHALRSSSRTSVSAMPYSPDLRID